MLLADGHTWDAGFFSRRIVPILLECHDRSREEPTYLAWIRAIVRVPGLPYGSGNVRVVGPCHILRPSANLEKVCGKLVLSH